MSTDDTNKPQKNPKMRGKPFAKGNKLSPGRPRLPPELKSRCREITDSLVIPAWIAEVQSLGPNWMKASELLAAYGYGKPSQAVEVTGANGAPLSIRIDLGEK